MMINAPNKMSTATAATNSPVSFAPAFNTLSTQDDCVNQRMLLGLHTLSLISV
jgi:hypothetical protein